MNENIPVTNDTDNSEAISKLIESIQSKLNNELDTSNNQDITQNSNLSSDNINNQKNSNENPNSNFDLGSIMGLLGNLNSNNNSNTDTSNDSSFNFSNLDPALFSKLQKIVVSLGKKDPKKDLLVSLKPFLRKSRQDKIGEYITILTIIRAFEAFNEKGSDENE